MTREERAEGMAQLPMKSVAGALLFSVFLGPIGLLYASTFAGVLLIVLIFIGVCVQQFVTVLILWMVSCIVSVMAVNRYNRKILRAKITTHQG